MQKLEIIHYPNLKTVLMVEDALKKANNLMTREQLKKIVDGRKGILWIYNPSPKLDKAIQEGVD